MNLLPLLNVGKSRQKPLPSTLASSSLSEQLARTVNLLGKHSLIYSLPASTPNITGAFTLTYLRYRNSPTRGRCHLHPLTHGPVLPRCLFLMHRYSCVTPWLKNMPCRTIYVLESPRTMYREKKMSSCLTSET